MDLGLKSSGGVKLRGRMDILDQSGPYPKVLDIKTISAFNPDWLKSPEDLARNIQLSVYGKHVLDVIDPKATEIEYAHIYLLSRGAGSKRVPTGPLSRDHVNGVWQELDKTISAMEKAVFVQDHNDVRPNWDACYDYRKQCPYYDYCKSRLTTLEIKTKMEKDVQDFEAKLAARKASQGINPPDAAPKPVMEQFVQQQIGTPVVTSVTGFSLYVDSAPNKGLITYLDAEIAQRTPNILVLVGKREGKDFSKFTDVRSVPFGAGTAALIEDFKRNPPTGIVVADSVGLQHQLIEVLAPMADVVVRRR